MLQMEREQINELIMNPINYNKHSQNFINKLIALQPDQLIKYIYILKSIMENPQERAIRKTFVVRIVKDGLLISSYTFYVMTSCFLLPQIKKMAGFKKEGQNKQLTIQEFRQLIQLNIPSTARLQNHQAINLIKVCQEMIQWFGRKIEAYPYSEINFSSAFKILNQKYCRDNKMTNLFFRQSDGQKYDSNFMEQMMVFRQTKKSMARFLQGLIQSLLDQSSQINNIIIVQAFIQTGDSFIITTIVNALAQALRVFLDQEFLQEFQKLLKISKVVLQIGQRQLLVLFQRKIIYIAHKALVKLKSQQVAAIKTSLVSQIYRCYFSWKLLCRNQHFQYKSQLFDKQFTYSNQIEIKNIIKEVQQNIKVKKTQLNLITVTNEQKSSYILNQYQIQKQKSLNCLTLQKNQQIILNKSSCKQQDYFNQKVDFKDSVLMNQNQQSLSKYNQLKYQSKVKVFQKESLIQKRANQQNSADFVKQSQLDSFKDNKSQSNLNINSSVPFRQEIKDSIKSRISKKIRSKRNQQLQAIEQLQLNHYSNRNMSEKNQNLTEQKTTDNSSSNRKINKQLKVTVTQFVKNDEFRQPIAKQKHFQLNQKIKLREKSPLQASSLSKSPQKPQFKLLNQYKDQCNFVQTQQKRIIRKQYEIIQQKIKQLKVQIKKCEQDNFRKKQVKSDYCSSGIQSNLSNFSQCFKAQTLKNKYHQRQIQVKNNEIFKLEESLEKLIRIRQLLKQALEHVDSSNNKTKNRSIFKQLCQQNLEVKRKLLINSPKKAVYQEANIDQKILQLPQKQIQFAQISKQLQFFLVNRQCILYQDDFLKIGLKFSSKQSVSKLKIYFQFKRDIRDFRYQIQSNNFTVNLAKSSQIFAMNNYIPSGKQIKLMYFIQQYIQNSTLSQLKVAYITNGKTNTKILSLPISKEIQYLFKYPGDGYQKITFGFITPRFKPADRLSRQGRNYLRQVFREGYFKDINKNQYISVQQNKKLFIFKLIFDQKREFVWIAGQNFQKDEQKLKYILTVIAKPII